MSVNLAINKPNIYVVSTPIYEGPLDLLLQLIERAELDITKLALAIVTNQYLEYLHALQLADTEEISAFLVIAAKLVQIKSAALLPNVNSGIDQEEDLGEQLVKQLLEYKKYKIAAERLGLYEEKKLKGYLHIPDQVVLQPPFELKEITLADLIDIARYVLLTDRIKNEFEEVVLPNKITIRQKIMIIADEFRKNKALNFFSLFQDNSSRIDIVVTFLALLELVKQNLVKVYQKELFGNIEMELDERWDLTSDFDLEFGE